MITIFNGRERRLGVGAQTTIYAQVSVDMRKHLHLFKGAKLAVFLAIALHANENGIASPSIGLLCQETGYGEEAVLAALRGLEKTQLDGFPVLSRSRHRSDGAKWGNNRYLIFPAPGETDTENPFTENPCTVKSGTKYNHLKPEPSLISTPLPPLMGEREDDVVLSVAKPALDSQNQPQESEGGEHGETISLPEVETFARRFAPQSETDTPPVEVDVWREKRGASRSPVAQKENEKPLAMLAAYRSVRYPGKPNYTRSEWNAFKTNLRALVDDGRTTEEMATATATALATWTTPEMVNPRSVAAHFDTLLETAAKRCDGQTAAPSGTPASLGRESALNGQSQGRAERTHIDETLPCNCGKPNGRHRVYCSCMVLGPYRGHLSAQHIGESARSSGKSFLFEAAMAGFPEAEALQMKAEWEANQ